jgi:hypothetical protein
MVSESDVPQRAGGQEVGSKPVDPVAGKTVAEILGEIVWLMTQDPAGREMKVAEIEALVMPAILARRFHIKYAQVPDMRRLGATILQPVGVELFEAPYYSNAPIVVLRRFSLAPKSKTGPTNGSNLERTATISDYTVKNSKFD